MGINPFIDIFHSVEKKVQPTITKIDKNKKRKKMVKITKEMIKAGNEMAEDLVSANIRRDMMDVLSLDPKEKFKYNNSDLVDQYLSDSIDSVTAIYLAMDRER